MTNDPILRLLGLARKGGRAEIGEEPVGAACRARRARLVLLSEDAASNTRRRAAHFGRAGDVPFLEIPFTKEELGGVLGRSSCAMLALTDPGLAAAVLEKLAARDPERYAPAARTLRVQADRAIQRSREQRRHEKNLREGKRRLWAPPPVQRSAPPERSRPGDRGRGAAPRPQQKDRPAPASWPDRPGPGKRRSIGKIPKKRGGTPL